MSIRSPRPLSVNPVALWLFAICAMLWVMVVLGGTTRLTGSGLSIMEWRPIAGVLPPLTHADWLHLFALYRGIPQYTLLHPTMDLAGFQQIFWLEWVHRLWGRLLGFAFLLPLLYFAVKGRLSRRLLPRLVVIFMLGGLQGAVGWFMVASGFFSGSTAVSAVRLVMHLGLALSLFAAILWTALGVQNQPAWHGPQAKLLRRLAMALIVLVALTILAGGFTAGLHAGLIDNSFPLMDGRLVPPDYARISLPRGWFENPVAAQFNHRVLATLTALVALTIVGLGIVRGGPRLPVLGLGVCVTVQYVLGVLTLLYAVPVPLAAAHQANAVLLLSVALVLLHRLREPSRQPMPAQGLVEA